jgi:serine protease Do
MRESIRLSLIGRVAVVFVIFSLFFIPHSFSAELPDFTELIAKHSLAVVKITAVSKGSRDTLSQQLPQDLQGIPDIFRELLERRQIPRDRGSMGSGFIISSDGYVLTNDHVVEGMEKVTVILSDQREFSADLVGRDERSDIALLKIDAKNLPTLTLAREDNLKVGQWVVAIGSPFGLDYSATAGIVSAIGRSIPSAHTESNYVPFIQTDVAINPGNSGGPLFNLKGEVVGINSQIFSPSGGSVGLSFAIPSSLAIDVVAQLKDKGHVDRGWLGVMIQNVDKDLASSLGIDKPMGALISEIDEKGPAAKAGLKNGDLIIKFNAVDVNTSSDLPYLVGRTPPKTKVPVVIVRRGKEQTLSVTVGVLPTSPEEVANHPASKQQGNELDVLGLVVRSLNPSDASGTDLGVVVQDVKAGSPAAEAGLQIGDVITQLAFNDIKSPADYTKIVKGLPKNEPQAIRFYRDKRPVFRSIVIK